MADDFEYAVISDPEVGGFFTGAGGSPDDLLSEDICKAAAGARNKELRGIKHLRGRLAVKRRSGNIAQSTYDRGVAILDARQDALVHRLRRMVQAGAKRRAALRGSWVNHLSASVH